MCLFPWSNILYAYVLPKPALILYLCNTASPLDAATSIPIHLSQRMSKTTTTSFFSWRGAFPIALAVAAFFMVDPYIRKLLSFVQEHCIAELSPYGFGAFVCLLVVCCFYILLGRYRNTYIPVQLRCGLLLLAAAYLYYRLSPCYYYRLSPEFYFWRIPLGDWAVFRATWTDLLFLPWLYVMGGRGVLRYLSSNRRCMRMLRVLGFRDVWPNCLCKLQAEVGHQEKQVTSSNISGPIEHAEDDELDFNPKVSELAKELRGLDLKERSTCYGIIAPWGYGKTSFLNLLSNELSADGIVVTFNPRSAKSVEHIQEDFFAKLAQELSQHYWGAGLIVSRYAEQIGILNHYSKVRLIADALRLLRFKGSKATVSNAIEKIGKRLYIVLDDLDRLEGKELLETIKLIDITASFKNTVFLVACDKKYANDVLQAYLGSNPGLGYLDKYIAVEVQLSEYIEDKLNQMMVRYLREQVRDGKLVTQDTVLQSWDHIAPYIITHLGTCRGIKQYFKLFINDFGKVQDYVDPVDFFLLTLLKYKDKGVYDAVKYRIHFGNGEPFFSFASTDRWDNNNLPPLVETGTEAYDSMVKDCCRSFVGQTELVVQSAQWNGAIAILWMLFPNSKMVEELQLPFAFKEGYWRKSNAPYSAIRYRRSFTSYFPDLVDDDSASWNQDILAIVKCRDVDDVSQILDRRYNDKDAGALVHLISDHFKSFSQPNGAWATAVRIIIYIVDLYDDYTLKLLLISCLRQRGSASIDVLEARADQQSYKSVLNGVLNDAIKAHPLCVCELLAVVGNPQRQGVRGPYIYTEDEADIFMLKAMKRYFDKYTGLQLQQCNRMLNELLQDEACFTLQQELTLLVIDWVQTHPEESAGLLLYVDRESPNMLYVRFQYYVPLLKKAGFSLWNWLSAMKNDTKASAVCGVVMEAYNYGVKCRDFNTNRRLDDISYIHEAFVQYGLIKPRAEGQ